MLFYSLIAAFFFFPTFFNLFSTVLFFIRHFSYVVDLVPRYPLPKRTGKGTGNGTGTGSKATKVPASKSELLVTHYTTTVAYLPYFAPTELWRSRRG